VALSFTENFIFYDCNYKKKSNRTSIANVHATQQYYQLVISHRSRSSFQFLNNFADKITHRHHIEVQRHRGPPYVYHSRYCTRCTGCICLNGSTLNRRSWHTECWTVWPLWHHHIWINSFQYQACQVVAICGRRSRWSCTSHSTNCQQPF